MIFNIKFSVLNVVKEPHWLVINVNKHFILLIQESVEKDRLLKEANEKHENDVAKLEIELATTKSELDETKERYLLTYSRKFSFILLMSDINISRSDVAANMWIKIRVSCVPSFFLAYLKGI